MKYLKIIIYIFSDSDVSITNLHMFEMSTCLIEMTEV